MARDLTHTIFARLIKAELLVKMNLFNEAIQLIKSLHRGEKLPHHIDDKYISNASVLGSSSATKYVSVFFVVVVGLNFIKRVYEIGLDWL